MKIDVVGWMAGERIQQKIFAAQATQPASETSRLDRRSCVSKVRGQLKIKFKPVKTGPLLLPIGSRCFTSGGCHDRNRSP
jgi:hypothetical protein